MKKIFVFLMAALCCTFVGCKDDAWDNGDPAMEHIYYVGFQNWGTFKNDVVFNVAKGATVSIPVEFQSERVRSYDVTTYYYVSNAANELVRGTDYVVVDENGATLNPDSNGAFSMLWPQAKRDVKNINIKALNGATGSFMVHTFNPAAGAIAHPDNITNSKTNDYEVRAFTQNYKVKVNVK